MKVKNIAEFDIGLKYNDEKIIIPFDGNTYTIPDELYDDCKGMVEVLSKNVKTKNQIEKEKVNKEKLDIEKQKPLFGRNCKRSLRRVREGSGHLFGHAKPLLMKERKKWKWHQWTYNLEDPVGNVYKIESEGLQEFCINENLDWERVEKYSTKDKTLNGWKIKRTKKDEI